MTLESLYVRYEPTVRWILTARGVSEPNLDDLVHECFVAVARRWPTRDPRLPIRTWIRGVAQNVAFSHRRAEARRLRHLQALPVPEPAPAPEEVLARSQAWHQLQDFMAQLSPKLREVFVLVELGAMPMHEVAQMTGLSINTMHSRLRLARARFERHFDHVRAAEERRVLLRRAAEEARPSRAARRRALALVVAEVGKAEVSRAGFTGAGWLALEVAAAAVVVVAATSVIPSQSSARAPVQVRSSPSIAARSSPTVDAPFVASSVPASVPRPIAELVPTPTARPVRASAAVRTQHAPAEPRRPTPSEADRLASHVQALAEARALSRGGRHRAALERLDGLSAPHPSLERDHRRIELVAACGARSQPRAEAAAAALAALGLRSAGVEPCPARIE